MTKENEYEIGEGATFDFKLSFNKDQQGKYGKGFFTISQDGKVVAKMNIYKPEDKVYYPSFDVKVATMVKMIE